MACLFADANYENLRIVPVPPLLPVHPLIATSARRCRTERTAADQPPVSAGTVVARSDKSRAGASDSGASRPAGRPARRPSRRSRECHRATAVRPSHSSTDGVFRAKNLRRRNITNRFKQAAHQRASPQSRCAQRPEGQRGSRRRPAYSHSDRPPDRPTA